MPVFCTQPSNPLVKPVHILHVLYVSCPVLPVSACRLTPFSGCLQAAILAGSRQTQSSDVTMVDAGPWPTGGGNRQQVSTHLWLDTPQLWPCQGCCQLLGLPLAINLLPACAAAAAISTAGS